MKIIDVWKEKLESDQAQDFYNQYLEEEMGVYKRLLANKQDKVAGKLSELAKDFNMESWVFAGFIDGINTSLKKEVNLEKLTEESDIDLRIDFNKLYYNMLKVKATWLSGLEEWDNVFTFDQRKEIKKQFTQDHTAVRDKVGRNDPCPCGSGKKYKKCCLK